MELLTILSYGSLAVLCYTLYGLIWRLYLSPVAKFPGSKLAAATFWYEFYFDVIKGGQYVYEIERMHKQYGTSNITASLQSIEKQQAQSFGSTRMSYTSTTQIWSSCPSSTHP